MNFQSIKPQKGSELVMQHLREQIAAGVYPPGGKLPTVVELAASYQVGRSTIREALSGLKATGWLTIRHGGGTYVSPQPPKEAADAADAAHGLFYHAEQLQEVLDVRKYIEVGCVSLAAERRTPDDLMQIERALDRMREALDDEEASNEADIHFHLCLAAASHNSLLISMMESMTGRLQESMRESRRLWFFADRASAEALFHEHELIYEAVRERDVPLAADRIMQHISKVDRVIHRLDGRG